LALSTLWKWSMVCCCCSTTHRPIFWTKGPDMGIHHLLRRSDTINNGGEEDEEESTVGPI
jgi:hypothetical protein